MDRRKKFDRIAVSYDKEAENDIRMGKVKVIMPLTKSRINVIL